MEYQAQEMKAQEMLASSHPAERYNLVQLHRKQQRAVDSEEDSDDIERDIVDEDEDRLTERKYTAGSPQQSSDLQETVEKTTVSRPGTVRPN